MPDHTQSFVCAVCGESHAGLPTDKAFNLPDEVWAIPLEEREAKARWTKDLCKMGKRYFIRCLLAIPFNDQPGHYGWGAWAEVEWPVFQRYLELYEVDATKEPPVSGYLANNIPTYGQTLGLPIEIQFSSSTQRPSIHFAADQSHKLAMEAREGMSYARYHEILIARGLVSES